MESDVASFTDVHGKLLKRTAPENLCVFPSVNLGFGR